MHQITDTDYGVYDQPTTTVDKRGNPVTRNYYATTDAATFAVAGKVSELRATVNGTPNVLLRSYTYYANGTLKQMVEQIDPTNPSRKRITDYTWQNNGLNLQSVVVSGSGQSSRTTYGYDSLGRKTTEKLTRRISATDTTPMALTTSYLYDALDRVWRVFDPAGDIHETVYDGNGKIYQEKVHHKQPGGNYIIRTYATHTYDAADRRISTTDILGNTTTFAYDEAGSLIAQTDANGHVTRYEYDAMNRKTAIVDANGHRTEMLYDLDGRLVATKDPDGHTTRYEYDALGRRTRVITPMGFETQTEY
ncbi:MAG: hypothetical protein AB1568_16875 [Thermodesulfobacteriota bacterium]